MTRLIADSEHMDHVTILLARVCAARLDATIAADDFVRMVARLVDVAVAEAIEDVESMRQLDESARIGDRVAALGFSASQPPAKEDRRASGGGTLFAVSDSDRPSLPSSTGAADAGSRADHQDGRAASEAPAAPSTNATSEPQQSPGAALSKVSRSYTADNDRSKAVAADETPRARAGAEASQSASKKPGRAPLLSQPVKDALVRDYWEARRSNGGDTPHGWVEKQAKKYDVSYQTIYRAIGVALKPIAGRDHTHNLACWCRTSLPGEDWCTLHRSPTAQNDVPTRHRVVTAAPAAEPLSSAPSKEGAGSATGAAPREHTDGHNCWCRKRPDTASNRWCVNAPTPAVLPGLRSRVQPTPRNERFSGERARRDSFEGEA